MKGDTWVEVAIQISLPEHELIDMYFFKPSASVTQLRQVTSSKSKNVLPESIQCSLLALLHCESDKNGTYTFHLIKKLKTQQKKKKH